MRGRGGKGRGTRPLFDVGVVILKCWLVMASLRKLCVYQVTPHKKLYRVNVCVGGWVGGSCIAASAFSARLGRASAHFVSFFGAFCVVAKYIAFGFRAFFEAFRRGMRCVPFRVMCAAAAIDEGFYGLEAACIIGWKAKTGGWGIECAPSTFVKRYFVGSSSLFTQGGA